LLVCWLGVIAALAIPGQAAEPRAAANAAVHDRVTPPLAAGRSTAAANGAILALLPNAEDAAQLLNAAQALGKIFGRPVAALHVRIDPQTTIIPSAEILTTEAWQEISHAQNLLAAEVARAAAAWQTRAGAKLTLLEPFGAETAQTARAAADAAALVAPLPAAKNLSASAMNTVIFETERPVLAMPAGSVFNPAGHVAIGWKDIPHARAAITAALPLIAKAQQITLIAIGDPKRLNIDQGGALLGQHAARIAMINPPRDNRNVGEQLLAEAKKAGADTLVLGAHRHGRVAEWMLGGVTGTVLASADIPLFLKQ
jgi:nucleotide-binding universal stress UspA family protein